MHKMARGTWPTVVSSFFNPTARDPEDFYPQVRNVRIHLSQAPRQPYTRDIH